MPPQDGLKDNKVEWATTGVGQPPWYIYGDEKGYVQYNAQTKDGRPIGTVTFHFSNPTKGTNTCNVVATSSNPALGEIASKCRISQSSITWVPAYIPIPLSSADAAFYCIWYNSPGPTNCPIPPSHTVLEKKPTSYVHTTPSGKMVLPHINQIKSDKIGVKPK
jgi:hypothetical protein